MWSQSDRDGVADEVEDILNLELQSNVEPASKGLPEHPPGNH